MSEDQNIGFQDPDEEDMPPELKDHMLAAFQHAAGLGPHPGMYQGPPRRRRGEPTETDLQSAREEPIGEELNARKMHAADGSQELYRPNSSFFLRLGWWGRSRSGRGFWRLAEAVLFR
jgi:hypothetical protein